MKPREAPGAALGWELDEPRLRSLLDSSLDGVIGIGDGGRITYWNPSAERMFGWRRAEALGRHVVDLIIPERYRRSRRRRLQRLLETGDAARLRRRLQLAGLRRDGGEFPIEIAVSAVRVAEDWTCSIFVADVSAHEQAERTMNRLEAQLLQAQRMEAVGRLAGGIAHDFNNLLTAVVGYSELILKHTPEESPWRRYLLEIRRAGDRASALTRQLLAFSRRQVLIPQVMDLRSLVTDLGDMLQWLIGEDVTLETVHGAEPARVKADPAQIEQVILNLAVNARDAMPRGGRLTVEVKPVDLDESYARSHMGIRPGPYVLLAVIDTGIGMDPETRSHIFEPFFTTKEKDRGTGLGLSTVYGIVEQSGGHIWVYSEPGQGSVFKIYLPRVDESVEARLRPDAGPVPRGTETILLVEDEDLVRRMARAGLEGAGYKILEAASGDQALAMARTSASTGGIDLLLTDVVMPGISGRELAERVMTAIPGIRLLYMSGYTDDAIIRRGLISEQAGFLQKPFTPDSLARKVREVLDAGS